MLHCSVSRDTAGQERFHTFTKQFFRGAQGILLVYDITSMASFQTLMRWIQTIRDVGLEHISLVVVGNKMDLAESRQVPRSNGERVRARNDQSRTPLKVVYSEAS